MITINTQPSDFGRIYDTNRLMYKMSSTNYSMENFRFYINVYVGDITQNPVTYTNIGVVRKRPLSDGTCYFNPAELWSNYLTHDLEINISGLTEALNSNAVFSIAVLEEYGNPPTVITESVVESDVITLYNGIQEYIPYDIVDYGGGNDQWKMSGVTINTAGYSYAGNWVNETGTLTSGEIKYTGTDITSLTQINISLTDNDGRLNTNLNNISPTEYVMFENNSDTNQQFVIKFDTKTDYSTYTSWTDITYMDKTASMPLSGFPDGTKVNIYWVESNASTGIGKYLTDALDYRVDINDYSNLYFLSDKSDRPTAVQIKVYYWSDGIEPVGGGGDFIINKSTVLNTVNTADSAPNPTRGFQPPDPEEKPDPGEPITPQFNYFISSYTTGYTINYSTTNNQMYYIPTGPKELNDMGIFDRANLDGGWISYKINLTSPGYITPSKIYNKYPMWYYRQNKCDKYDAWQIFWLNPHGGFDRYTFYKKNYISYDLERTTWEHRFSDTYVLGERGTTVYKTKATENVLLNTDWLSSSEAQTLGQMMMSPEVFAVYEYNGNVYKIPYIINDSKFDYKEIKNEKMVSMAINITPAWNRVSQTT